jgi:hypothetical protein
MAFACPHCGTPIRLTLVLDDPPHVKIRFEENVEVGDEEGAIINLGAGFAVRRDKLHEDQYFPSFDAPQPTAEGLPDLPQGKGPISFDMAVSLGTLPRASTQWGIVKRALRFHRTSQDEHRDVQIKSYWPNEASTTNVEETLYHFLVRFLRPKGEPWVSAIAGELKRAYEANSLEYSRFVEYYDAELKVERFSSYSDIFSEYFRGYGDFSQTLVYVRLERPFPVDGVVTSTDFDRTRMFYGNAFEVLGSHLDVVAAINNIISGRPFDQMKQMDLAKFRVLNKANRVQCFSENSSLATLIHDYDSAIRNASHHRWFKLDDARTQISYRSGGTGALRVMPYWEYLIHCNRIASQLMVLAAAELVLLSGSGRSL